MIGLFRVGVSLFFKENKAFIVSKNSGMHIQKKVLLKCFDFGYFLGIDFFCIFGNSCFYWFYVWSCHTIIVLFIL